jgi:hypothetical protein
MPQPKIMPSLVYSTMFPVFAVGKFGGSLGVNSPKRYKTGGAAPKHHIERDGSLYLFFQVRVQYRKLK